MGMIIDDYINVFFNDAKHRLQLVVCAIGFARIKKLPGVEPKIFVREYNVSGYAVVFTLQK